MKKQSEKELKTVNKRMNAFQAELAAAHRNLILTFLKRRGLLYEVYEPILCVALCEAAVAFKPSSGVRFSNYAWVCMENAVTNEKMKNQREKRKLLFKTESLNRIITNDEGESVELGDYIPDPNNTVDIAMANIAYENIMSRLSYKDKCIVEMFKKGYSQIEIAKTINRSEARVSQLKRKIINMVREELA